MRTQRGPSGAMVELDSGVLVPTAFHDELLSAIEKGIPRLHKGIPYKAKEAVEPYTYKTRFGHDPWRVGYCVAHWERRHQIPLRFLGCPFCSVRYYERT